MLISATSDLDMLAGNYENFWLALQTATKPDLLLLAGDICVNSWRAAQWSTFLNYIERKRWDCPIVAVWGNREFDEHFEKIKRICAARVVFLTDESFITEIGGKRVGIVGTRGCLDQPTTWQDSNIPNIKELYKRRFETVSHQLAALDVLKVDVKILLMHYAPTYKTLKGEDPDTYAGLGYEKFEETIKKAKPSFVVHGHAHYGIPLAFVDNVPVFNVAFSVNKKIVEIDTEKLPEKGLRAFV